MRKILIFLVLLFFIGITSAATISSQAITVIPPATSNAAIVLDTAPQGLSGCNVTVTIADPSIATITGISYDSWASIHANSNLPGNSVTFSEADLGEAKQAGSTGIILAYITVSGVTTGSTQFTVSVSECDDDNGNPIGPSTTGSPINVIGSAVKPVSPNLWAGVGTGNKSSILIPASSADSWAFFISYGYQGNTYPFKTDNKTGPGNQSFKIENYPLMPGQTLYYRAATNESGQWVYSPEVTMVIPTLTPGPTTTYGNYTTQFLDANGDPIATAGIIWAPYQAKIGIFFFSLMIGMAFIALWQKSGSVVIPLLAFFLTGIMLIPLMGPQFVKLAEAMVIASLTGMLFYFFTGGN